MDDLPLSPYDIIMLVVLVGATLLGAVRGFAWQVASLASIAISYLVACEFRGVLAERLPMDAPWNRITAMLILYIGTSLSIWLAFRFVREFMDRLKLKEFDRQVGAVVGLVKGGVFCILITLFAVTLLGDDLRRQIIDSNSGYYIAVAIDKAHGVIPDEVHEVLEPYLHTLDERLDDPPPHHFDEHALPAWIQGAEAAADGETTSVLDGTRLFAE